MDILCALENNMCFYNYWVLVYYISTVSYGMLMIMSTFPVGYCGEKVIKAPNMIMD